MGASPRPHHRLLRLLLTDKSKTGVLPRLPEEVQLPQRKSGNFPTILRPGIAGRLGRFRTSSTNNGSMSELLPSLYTTLPAPISLLQIPVQEHPFECSSERLGAHTPAVITSDLLDEHYKPSFPIAQPHTAEQFHQEQGHGKYNSTLSSGQTPQQYSPAPQGYAHPQQKISPLPQTYPQSYTPQNYAPPSPQQEADLLLHGTHRRKVRESTGPLRNGDGKKN
ncbi:hypothetical protein DFH29DRAFT_1005398 [Suillus ampliporus]|nr:hypothetical protein DFH29DRAFT_1005398 [Suillus ampliporus]